MKSKLSIYYRVSICTALLLMAANIVVKTIVWQDSLQNAEGDYQYAIRIRKHIDRGQRITTKFNQTLFNKVDYLLAPAFSILFAAFAVKLMNTPGVFEDE